MFILFLFIYIVLVSTPKIAKKVDNMIAKNKKPERVEDKRLNEVKGIYDLKKDDEEINENNINN